MYGPSASHGAVRVPSRDIIIWPIRPGAGFHCKTIGKIPVRGPYALALAGRKNPYGPTRNT